MDGLGPNNNVAKAIVRKVLNPSAKADGNKRE